MSQSIPASSLDDPAVLQLPALPPPPGITSNFTSPKDRGPILIIVNGILLGLMVIFLAIRFYTKFCIVRKVFWDDLTICVSALGATVLYVVFVLEIKGRTMGLHQWNVHLGELIGANNIITSYIITVTSTPTLGVTKLTFFLLYIQIFWPMRWMRMSVYIGATLSTACYVGFTIALYVLITPRPGQSWRAQFLSKRERGAISLSVPTASVGLVVDVLLLILPSVAIYKLQLHTTRKIGLMLIFSTGLVAVAASAVSIYVRHSNIHTKDQTWTLLEPELMALLEVQVGVITASMPSFARMLHHHLPTWKQLKSRFSLRRITSEAKGSKLSLSAIIQGSKAAKPENKLPSDSGSAHVSLERKIAQDVMSSTPHFEMDTLKTVKTLIRGERRDNVSEDGIYLQHDLEHTWSPMGSSADPEIGPEGR